MASQPTPRSLAIALFAPVALLALLAAAPIALAGGVAVVVAAPGDGSAPTAGEPKAIEFTVLQHGRSPWTNHPLRVVAVNTGTGETFRVDATPAKLAGGYTATLTYPAAGWWAWHIESDEIAIESGPTTVGVFGASGDLPVYSPDAAGQPTVTDTMNDQIARLDADRARLTAQRDAALAKVTTAEHAATGTVPIGAALAAVLSAAVIAGSLGVLAGRTRRSADDAAVGTATAG